MIYVLRDESGNINDLEFSPKPGYEKHSLFNDEIKKFIIDADNQDIVKSTLTKLDLEMVRVAEDIIEILIQKEIMLFTDLPEAVQNKLMIKRFLRESLKKDTQNFMEEEEIQF